MLNIELRQYGLDNTLEDIMEVLENALGNNNSKRYKDEMIYQALGYVEALFHMVQVVEVVKNDECESE